MHPRVYKEFEKICAERNVGGAILEIGALPDKKSLLNMKALQSASEKIGLNLEGPSSYKDFHVIAGNANDMRCFEAEKFDTVLCNAVLEHDKFFWKTLAEMKRVTKPGGLIVIGTPGYTVHRLEKYLSPLLGILRRIAPINRYLGFGVSTTPTLYVHDAPGDYYRYSPQAFKEVFFEGMKDVQIQSIMVPPRIIGSGIKP